MPKDLTLESLDKSLEQSKSEELERVRKIEQKSMEELAQSLKASLQTELSSIEDDMTKRLNKLRTKMTEARKKIIEDEKATLATLRTNRKEIESESQSLMQSQIEVLQKMNIRTMITPILMLLTLLGGIAIGWYLQKPTPKVVEKIVEKKIPIKTVWTVSEKMQREDADGYYVRVQKSKVFPEEGSTMNWVMIRSKK